VEVTLNRLKTAVEGEASDVVLEHHITAIEDAGGFIKAAMAPLFLGKHNAVRNAGDLGTACRVDGRFVLVHVGLTVLVAAGTTQQQVLGRAEVHSWEHRVFKRVVRIAVGTIEPLALPAEFY